MGRWGAREKHHLVNWNLIHLGKERGLIIHNHKQSLAWEVVLEICYKKGVPLEINHYKEV